MFDIKKFQPDIGFADDHQLYLGFTPPGENLKNSTKHIENCINKIRHFLLTHNLLINHTKTENRIFGTEKQLEKIKNKNVTIRVGNCNILPTNNVKNLDVIFDSNLNLKEQINLI